MHRSLCRVIRGTCRKFRENDCPSLAGEEVRQNRNKSQEEFAPKPKHSLTEALGNLYLNFEGKKEYNKIHTGNSMYLHINTLSIRMDNRDFAHVRVHSPTTLSKLRLRKPDPQSRLLPKMSLCCGHPSNRSTHSHFDFNS
jgi:hypothetical protein